MRLNITLLLLTGNPLAFTDIVHFVCDGLAKHNLNAGIESRSISTWTDQSSTVLFLHYFIILANKSLHPLLKKTSY